MLQKETLANLKFHIWRKPLIVLLVVLLGVLLTATTNSIVKDNGELVRPRISLNNGWKFFKYESQQDADNLIYDVRPQVKENWTFGEADDKPTEAENVEIKQMVLKPWILPSGNDFIKDPANQHVRPDGNPGNDFPFVQKDYDDSKWEDISLPHDWAIDGPFYEGPDPEVSGGMGRLPVHGVAWYRKKLEIPVSDSSKIIYLDVDGAMSYAMVWLNGKLVGGWPFGYNSFRLDLTPYVNPGGDNQLAIRLDNPNHSSRWYTGGGIYRNVWLVKTNPVHIAQWGSKINTEYVSENSAEISLDLTIENRSDRVASISTVTEFFELDGESKRFDGAVAEIVSDVIDVPANETGNIKGSLIIESPKLWGPPPTQVPNMYIAVTRLSENGKVVDEYKTPFGIRSLKYDPDSGVYVNNELIKLNGVNQHHDLGAIGAAFNTRAAERQLEILRDMGCNAIRTAHNPPAPELLDLTDQMGFLVIDESFDVWERKKTPHDFHLIFPDWYEQDLRSMIRRDKNHPSVIMWSYGNEVGEQYTDEDGAELAGKLRQICKDEDPTRLTTSAMNWAKPDMPFPNSMDVISLNYQGQGIRQDPVFEGTDRIQTKPLFPDFHKMHPDKVIISSETGHGVSSRGIFLFPVTDKITSPVRDGIGGNPSIQHVSAYELYSADYGSSADVIFGSIDRNAYVGGEFVWTGFDYIGEPTPYYSSRSSYSGVIDLAGFKKERFYLYKSQWLPDTPMVHIIPHWNWPDRIGKVTPVHVFTSGDEAELFINGKSYGRKKKSEYEYRLRWDDIKYEPGEVKVIAYKNDDLWAQEVMKTTGESTELELTADRNVIKADGKDLSFITVKVVDENGVIVPTATNTIQFLVEGPGEIVATDNGDPTDFTPFPSDIRKAFSGVAVVIIRSLSGEKGEIVILAKSNGLGNAKLKIESN